MLFQLMVNPGFSSMDATNMVLELFKWLLVILSGLYVFVAVIISRQIGLMRATVKTLHTKRLQLISFVHLAASLILLVYFVLFL